ncbi:MAG: response regulator transcription factor [Kovacikia sp.]
MSNTPEINRQPSRGIRLMLIEDDPVFRLGLITALEEFPDLRVIFEADSGVAALRILRDWMGNESSTRAPQSPTEIAPDLVILSLDLSQAKTGQSVGLVLCQQLRARYPELPLLLLSAWQDPLQLAMALQAGASGYCPKGTEIGQLVGAIRVVANGKPYWNPAIKTITQALVTSQPAPSTNAGMTAAGNRPSPDTSEPRRVTGKALSNPSVAAEPNPFALLRRNLRRSGLQQIDSAIALLNAQLNDPDLSLIDQLYLTGRRRELRAARWLVVRLLTSAREREGRSGEATDRSLGEQGQGPGNRQFSPQFSVPSPQPTGFNPSSAASPPPGSPPLPSLQTSPAASLRSIRAALFDATTTKLQTSLRNLTSTPLEIDILKEEKKRELLYTILRKLEEILDDLRFSQVQPDQLVDKQTVILLDLWQTATTDFFGKYYTLQL